MRFSRAPIGVNYQKLPGMRQLGLQMHMNARELVVTMNNAEVTGDTAVILSTLSEVTQACVKYHQAYQLKKGSQ